MLHAAFPSFCSLISISCVALGFDDLGLRLSQVCAPLFAAMPKDSERTLSVMPTCWSSAVWFAWQTSLQHKLLCATDQN
jgi:hypothetical protein